MPDRHENVKEGLRFGFGDNWADFLKSLDEERIAKAEASLRDMLEVEDLKGMSFLDVGSGSGLFSLAARRLGARVHSFDYDGRSVACTAELKKRFFPEDPDWRVEAGDALDDAYIEGLGKFDVVYSWGVLHHTGAMWHALGNIITPTKPGGKLFLAIYNDQGKLSRIWGVIKKTYNALPGPVRAVYAFVLMVPFEAFHNLLKPHRYLRRWREYKKERGMSRWHDWVDWVGGYPFEVARPEEIFDFYKKEGFILLRLKTVAGYNGCNEFVFWRSGGVGGARGAGDDGGA